MSSAMPPDIAHIFACCQSLSGPESVPALLSDMRAYERAHIAVHVFKSPYYLWQWKAPETIRAHLKTCLETWVAAMPVGDPGIISLAVLYRRITALMLCPLRDLAEVALSQEVLKIDCNSLRDLAAIAHLEKDFALLTKLAGYGLNTVALDKDGCAQFADYMFQSHYQGLKEAIFQRRLTEDDLKGLQALRQQLVSRLGHDCRNSNLYDSVLAAVKGDLVKSLQHAAAARGQAGRISPYFQAALNALEPDTFQKLKDEAQNTASHILLDFPCTDHIDSAADDVVLVSCDQSYFTAYAHDFLATFAQKNPAKAAHIHCVGFAPDRTEITSWGQTLDIVVNYSVDKTLLEGTGAQAQDLRMGYYAGARYIHLPRYLQLYKRIIITDIDGIFHADVDEIWSQHDSVQLSTILLDPAYERYFAPWENIGAGAFACTDAPSHKAFANTLSAYLSRRFHESKKGDTRFFYSDQMGLLQSYLAHKNDCSFLQMLQTFAQSDALGDSARKADKKAFQQSYLAKG